MKPEIKDRMLDNLLLILEQRLGYDKALRAQDTLQIQLKNSIWKKMRNGEKLSVMENAVLSRVLCKALGRDTMETLRETAKMFDEGASK